MKKPFIEISNEFFSISAYDIKPLENYETPINKENGKAFPYCCDNHISIYKGINTWYEKFPNCCEAHKKLLDEKDFDKSIYDYVVDKVSTQLCYTQHCIEEHQNKEDWYNIITEYIEYNTGSFGQLLAGFGNPVGIDPYVHYLLFYIEKINSGLSEEQKQLLVKFIKREEDRPESENIDFDVLFDTYQKWLSIFPFEISFFKGLKSHFEKKFPVLNGKPQIVNRFTGIPMAKVHTKESLVQTLKKLTNDILTKVNSLSLHGQGLLSEPDKIKLELVINERKLKLKGGYLQNENRLPYEEMLTQWFEDEKNFIEEITPLLSKASQNESKKLTEKTMSVINELGNYNFSSHIKKEGYEITEITQLMQNHSGRDFMPYSICLLYEIGFLDYFINEFCNSKKEGAKKLGKIFSTSERRIRGNINVLDSGSNEDVTQYTSYKHKENIQKALKGL